MSEKSGRVLSLAHDDPGKDKVSPKDIAVYLHNLRSITIIRQLMTLIIATQQHRGASLAMLGGESHFAERQKELAREINNRIYTTQIINQDMSAPVPVERIKQLSQEWNTVRDWQGGSALENFYLHSHFITHQMKLVSSVAERANWFILSNNKVANQNIADNSPEGESLLVRFIVREIPELTEVIAKIRGLATQAAAHKNCDTEVSSNLDYLIKQLNHKKEKFRLLTPALHVYALRRVPSLIDLQIQDVKIVQLANFVQENIIDKQHIKLESRLIFNMATAIIENHSEVIRQGLDFIQNEVHRRNV